jgi:hypothetical protein
MSSEQANFFRVVLVAESDHFAAERGVIRTLVMQPILQSCASSWPGCEHLGVCRSGDVHEPVSTPWTGRTRSRGTPGAQHPHRLRHGDPADGSVVQHGRRQHQVRTAVAKGNPPRLPLHVGAITEDKIAARTAILRA